MTRLFAALAVIAAVALIGVTLGLTFLPGGDDRFAECRSSRIAGGNDAIGGDFTLVSETGETVTAAQVIDQPALIYFGYTFCPDVCPFDVARNAEAVEILEEKMGKIVKPVFISVDPARDTPEVVDDFTAHMHPRMLGLTGSPEQIKAAAAAYKTYYKAHTPAEGEEEYYLVDHMTHSYLVLPEHGFVDFFRNDATAQEIADKTACFIDAS